MLKIRCDENRLRLRISELEKENARLRQSNEEQLRSLSENFDVTAGKSIQAAQRDSEQRFRDFAEVASDWFWEMDADLRFNYMSPSFEQNIGRAAEESLGRTRHEIYSEVIASATPEEQAEWRKHLADLDARRPFKDFEQRWIAPDGETRFFLNSGRPFFDKAGNFAGFRGTASNITERKRTERRFTQLTSAINQKDEIVVLYDAEDRLVFCNDRFRAINKGVVDLIEPGVSFEALTRAGLERGLVFEAVGREEAWLSERLERHRNPRGPVEQEREGGIWHLIQEQRLEDGSTMAINTDITERKRLERALRDNEHLANDLAASSSDVFWELDANFRFTKLWGAGLEGPAVDDRAFGKTRWEMVGADIEGDELWRGHVETLRAHQPFRDFEYRSRRSNGEVSYWSTSGVPHFDEAGAFQGYRGIGRRITDKVLAENALRENQELLQLITNSMPALIAYIGHDQRYRSVNRLFETWYQKPVSEIIGRHMDEVLVPETYENLRESIERALAGEEVSYEGEGYTPDGVYRHFKLHYLPHRDRSGEVEGFFAMVEDISDSKKVMHQLEEQGRRLAEAQRIGNMGNWERSFASGELHWSDQVYRIFGLSEGDRAPPDRERFLAVVHDDDRAQVAKALQDAVHHGVPYSLDHRIVRPDGEVRIVHEEAELIHDEDGQSLRLAGTVLDITEHKQIEQALRDSEQLANDIAASSSDLFWETDAEHRLVKLWGAGVINDERIQHAIGKTRWELLGADVEGDTNWHAHREILNSHQPYRDFEYHTGSEEGGIVYWSNSGVPHFDENGEFLGYRGVGSNITARKQAELELQAEKHRAELADRAKSEFLANMSHELRTPLNAILGFSEIIKDRHSGLDSGEKSREYANHINSSGLHLLDLINDILDISKVELGSDELRETALDIRHLVEAVMVLVKGRARDGRVRIGSRLDDDLPMLLGDERKLKQILVNLLSNAIKFTPVGGRVDLDVRYDEGGGFVIQVSDTGIGIAPEELAKALQPFGQIESSLSRKHQGTGLGLPLSKELSELHGGSLELKSEPGVGTIVTVRLPAKRVTQKGAVPRLLPTTIG